MSLVVNQLCYHSDTNRPILDQVSCSIHASQVMGIIGPNGSGKTTLIKLILGLITPHSGDIRINEQSLASLSIQARARLLSAVLQHEQPVFSFSVQDIVSM